MGFYFSKQSDFFQVLKHAWVPLKKEYELTKDLYFIEICFFFKLELVSYHLTNTRNAL